MPVDFPRNVDRARATSKEVRMEIPVGRESPAAAYGIVAGFQLTPEEVAAGGGTTRSGRTGGRLVDPDVAAHAVAARHLTAGELALIRAQSLLCCANER